MIIRTGINSNLQYIYRVYHQSNDKREPLMQHQNIVKDKQTTRQKLMQQPFLFQLFRKSYLPVETKTSLYRFLKIFFIKVLEPSKHTDKFPIISVL